MAILRVRTPRADPRDVNLGPCLGRLSDFDVMRRRLDIALAIDPRRVRLPVELRQPER